MAADIFAHLADSVSIFGSIGHSRLTRPTVLPSPLRQKVGILEQRFFEAQSPGPPIPLSTLPAPPHDVTRKTRGQDGFAVLLSCRALSSPTTCRFIPALDYYRVVGDWQPSTFSFWFT